MTNPGAYWSPKTGHIYPDIDGAAAESAGLRRIADRDTLAARFYAIAMDHMGVDESAWDSMTEEYRNRVRAELDDFLTVDDEAS